MGRSGEGSEIGCFWLREGERKTFVLWYQPDQRMSLLSLHFLLGDREFSQIHSSLKTNHKEI